MKMWLWVENLGPKNDWMELQSVHFGTPGGVDGSGSGRARVPVEDAHFMLDPGRFLTHLHRWAVHQDQRTVYVFFDPQREYEMSGSFVTSITSIRNDVHDHRRGRVFSVALSINFGKVKVEFNGAP